MRRATVGDVEVVLVEEWARDGYDVVIRGVSGAYRHHIYRPRASDGFASDQWEEYAVNDPGPIAPSLFLPADALEALAAAAAGVAPAVPAHVDALEDTRRTRDRLLTILELEACGRDGEVGAITALERLRAIR
jgi:hypothetical protein